MVSAEMLSEIGLSQEDVAEFFRLEETKQYLAQEKLLRKYRKTYLDDVHKGERLISNIDYVIYEIHKNKGN